MADLATESEMQLFRGLANPGRVDFNRREQKPVHRPNELHTVHETDFVASENGSSSSRKKKRKRHKSHKSTTPPPSPLRRDYPPEAMEPEEQEEAFSQTPKGRAEKMGYLLELKKLRSQGANLTREYSTSDKLQDIKYEFERQKINLDVINGVSLMGDGLKFTLSGVEMANERLGPFLNLNGWSESVTSDMSRYNHVLERIYRRYFARSMSSLNPCVELGAILAGSMLMHHFQSKFLGASKPSATAPKSHSSVPIDRNVPPPEQTGSRRPTMRGPATAPRAPPAAPAMFSNLNPMAMFAGGATPKPTRLFPEPTSVPEIREVEERGPPTRRNTAMDVERVEEAAPPAEDIMPAYEEVDMVAGSPLNFDDIDIEVG